MLRILFCVFIISSTQCNTEDQQKKPSNTSGISGVYYGVTTYGKPFKDTLFISALNNGEYSLKVNGENEIDSIQGTLNENVITGMISFVPFVAIFSENNNVVTLRGGEDVLIFHKKHH